MSEDHGTKDAASGAVPGSDAAAPAPAAPAALTDKELDKVAGGVAVHLNRETTAVIWKMPGVATNTFRK